MAINIEVLEFAKRWKDKTSSNPDETIEHLFDKFISLYIAYNALYHQIAVQEKNLSDYKDGEAATNYVIDYITAIVYINLISDDKNTNTNVEQVISLLCGHEFVFSRKKNGLANKNDDIILANQLKSLNSNIKAKAITHFLYKVRCNIIHGSKSLTEDQRLVLVPANGLLLKTVNLLMKIIGDRNHQ